MRARKRVILVQLPIPPVGGTPIRGNVPLAAGYLKLYARQQGLEERFDIEILPASSANLLGDQALIHAIRAAEPDVVGFTCYLWNIDRTLWIARRLKERDPELCIVLGGPEITRDNDWVLASGAFDFAAIGEGEQTFAELLAHLAGIGKPLETIAGLAWRERAGGELRMGAPRAVLPELDGISSPYLHGILSAADEEQLLLETIRGCIFKCKFCYYPKAYDGIYYVSRERILANLAHAREHGAREVYLLDPTLNQRRDFAEFLALLAEGNPDGQLEYYAELRGEVIKPEHARLMREANFKEVEIGLQSIDPKAQELMDRRTALQAFERGVRALQAEGVRTKVDLIVGLPGDTEQTVREGMQYLAANKLYDEIQVFQLSILPGTAFRAEASALGLTYQAHPPYYVLRTPTLGQSRMLALLGESESIFETTFDPDGPPDLDVPLAGLGPGTSLARGCRIDLDESAGEAVDTPLPADTAQAFTLSFRAENFYPRVEALAGRLRELLGANPFTTLQVVLEVRDDFPVNVYESVRRACARGVNVYLDRFYEFTPGSGAGASRIVSCIDEERAERIDPDWVATAGMYSEFVYDRRDRAGRSLEECEPGIWRWLAPGEAHARMQEFFSGDAEDEE